MKRLRYIALTLLSLSFPAYAVVTVVPDGTTEVTTVTLADPDDVLIVEEGGAITVGGDAVTIGAANQTVLNQGSISTTGAGAERGIANLVGASNMVITNSGVISTVGAGAHVIRNDGGVNAKITNNGVLTSSGGSARGVASLGTADRAVIVNNGQILMETGTDQVGLQNEGANSLVINNGLISLTGAGTGTSISGIFNESANAANTTVINSGRILTTGAGADGILNNAANVMIASSGLISTEGDGADGIQNNGNSSMITNSGLISTEGDDASGIFNNAGDNVVIRNSGQILMTGNDAGGIVNQAGANAVITNSGLISTIGSSSTPTTASHGILNNGSSSSAADVVITNSGRIMTEGDATHGIFNLGVGILADNVRITNTGRITTLGDSALGINNEDGGNVVITNSGRISTEEDNAHAIQNTGDFAMITNSGQISTTGSLALGIFSNSDNSHIINSGTIRSAQSSALVMLGATPTLSLLRGSNLQGVVFVEVGNPLTLNVQTGLNLALTLDSSGSGFASFGITAPFAVLGSTIGVIDPTGLALQADVVADLSDTILDGIYRRRASLVCPCIAYGTGAWVQGLGSYRKRSREKRAVGYDNSQGGFLIGYDTICGEGNVGLFGGATYGEAEVDQQTQQADFTSYVGGVTYERLSCNTFFGCALALGHVSWDNQRLVMNNLAPGGVDTAKANTDGIFVSPEATLAYRFFSLWCQPVMTFTMRYAGLFLGDYAEQGSLTNLTVQDRHVDLLTGRFECALPYTTSCEGCCVNVEPYVGVYRRYQVGGKGIKSQFLGQTLRFKPGSPPTLVALLVGMRSMQSFDTFNLFVNLEASFDDHSSTRILGEAGLGFSF